MKEQTSDIKVQERKKFSKKDKAILLALQPVVDGIAAMFGGGCEVVLHSLEDLEHSLVKIANGHVTGRKEGASLTDHAVEMLKDASSRKNGRIETYYTKASDGTLMRSVTIPIRNEDGETLGFLCINLDLTVPVVDLLRTFGLPPRVNVSTEHFVSDVQQLIDSAISDAIAKVGKDRGTPNADKNKSIVFALYNKGIFNIKGAVDTVAQRIGTSRYTVYNYIREARVKVGPE